jgi:hypothetical protein
MMENMHDFIMTVIMCNLIAILASGFLIVLSYWN